MEAMKNHFCQNVPLMLRLLVISETKNFVKTKRVKNHEIQKTWEDRVMEWTSTILEPIFESRSQDYF